MDQLKELKKSNTLLLKAFQDLENQKKEIVERGNKELADLTQKQTELNTSIVKNQGKIELLEENKSKIVVPDNQIVTPK